MTPLLCNCCSFGGKSPNILLMLLVFDNLMALERNERIGARRVYISRRERIQDGLDGLLIDRLGLQNKFGSI